MEQLKKMYGKQLPFIPVVGSGQQEIRIPEEEKQEVIDYITTGIEQHMRGQNCELDVAAKYIKDKMDGRFGPTWQCILGTSWSPRRRHELRHQLPVQLHHFRRVRKHLRPRFQKLIDRTN